jgi:hypothetical protein
MALSFRIDGSNLTLSIKKYVVKILIKFKYWRQK